LDEHLKRLSSQCQEIHIQSPSINKDHIFDLIEKNKAHDKPFKLRITITGGQTKDIGLPLRKGAIVMTMTALDPFEKKSIRLALFSSSIKTPHLHLKTLSYLTRLFVMQEAKNRGFDDAIVFDDQGYILETAIANLFWTVGKDLYTPSQDLACLRGITLEDTLSKASVKGYRIQHVKAFFHDIPKEAYVYCSGSLKGIICVSEIEGKTFNVKPWLD
jgi:branched-subunit amino acid aminotransferase/4-amino-4-deoxychorismate lyase